MEPMALGSPTSGSPVVNSSYLPAFLMGGDASLNTTQRNTLSPEKVGGRNISFATPPQQCAEFNNRSILGQRTPIVESNNASFVFSGTPLQINHLNNSTNKSGPPTQDLFDSLRNDRNQVQTPVRPLLPNNVSVSQSPQPFSNLSMQNHQNASFLSMNASSAGNAAAPIFQQNESYLNHTSSHIASPLSGLGSVPGAVAMNDSMATPNTSVLQQSFVGNQSFCNYNNFWVTVFGFPLSSASNVLYHFAQCGTIVDKVFAPQGGNWVHIKYASRLECDRAMNYNEKIIMNNIMIGVKECDEKRILDKENLPAEIMGLPQARKLRSLANTAYLAAQSDISVTNNRPAAKNNSILHKAVDLLFG